MFKVLFDWYKSGKSMIFINRDKSSDFPLKNYVFLDYFIL